MAVRLESYSSTFPDMVRQGVDLRRHVKQHGDWIADGKPYSETVDRYRTFPHAIKNVRYLALLEPNYYPYIVRDEQDEVAGTATVYTRCGVQHPELHRPTTGADIDYTLTEAATDEQHLTTVLQLLGTTGSLALKDELSVASAIAVVPMQYADNRLRGFELAAEAGHMLRVEDPANLTVPKEFDHSYIDFAKGGQYVQLYYAPELPAQLP